MSIQRNKPANATAAVKIMHKSVCKIAHKAVKANKADFDDVYQYGMMGVVRAYNDFDEDNPTAAFSTLAYKYAYQHIMDHYMRKAYDYNNNKSFKSAEEHLEKSTYTAPVEDKIEMDQILAKLPTVDQIIILMRGQGWTYQEIAEKLNTVPSNEYTLHQIHTRHKKCLENI